MEERRRLNSTLVLRLLAFASLPATMVFWWLGTLPGHYLPEIGREIFGNIPGPMQAAFYVGVGAFLALTFYLFAERSRSWQRGADESRVGMWGERFRNMTSGLAMRTLLRDRAAGLMHALIYYGFLLLFLGTVTLEIDHLLPESLKFLHGNFYKIYSAVLDAAAIALIVGVVWAIVRRYGQAPWRLRSKTKAEDAWILTVLGLIGLTGVLTEAARIAVDGRPDFETWSFVGYPMSSLFSSFADGWHQIFWIVHVLTFVWFLVILPTTKLRHMVTSPANMFLAPRERPKGAMKALPNLMEATDIESIGASVITDLTWKQIFDTDACTVCGRCTSVCPANTTGKPLDPREMVMKVGEVAASTAPGRISTPVSVDAEITISADDLFGRITSEELWSCTTCRACDEICPVNIEILDKILDMRRYKALMEADFPSELGKAFVALENQGNPWGLSQQNRMDWVKDLDFEVKVLGDDGVDSADYLYWVGCAGSFDDRNVEVTKATARLLHEAGIDFAILGPKESCTGDPARRSGNEYLFQQLALSNIETLNDLGVEKVITQCPHCFNSLANDYPQLGGDYQVVHHSQLLMELVDAGSLDPAAATGKEPQITFHDPCYLGRHNDVYVAPREVVAASGSSLIEMDRNGTNAMCCG
ncbi:MAG: heterodisulfide reductase-related iron-sulfur binding cluster, partial [Acidimicrobiia bacterium]|nr:heterodisulfide reductase-related iron-sulfur binding cluster [Acidimicrobiia bacterium]